MRKYFVGMCLAVSLCACGKNNADEVGATQNSMESTGREESVGTSATDDTGIIIDGSMSSEDIQEIIENNSEINVWPENVETGANEFDVPDGAQVIDDQSVFVTSDEEQEKTKNAYLELVLDMDIDNNNKAELLLVEAYYDEALALYEDDKTEKTSTNLINTGFLYQNGLTYKGLDVEAAEECYINAKCVEADRNLLYLYLEQKMDEPAKELMVELLQKEDMEIEQYLMECLDDIDRIEAGVVYDNDNNEIDITEVLSSLYVWEATSQYYRGFNPPEDTYCSRWIWKGGGFNDSGNSYAIYQKEICRFKKANLCNPYYAKDDGSLQVLEW